MAIRRRDVEHHREWMIRMFAIAIDVSVVRITGTVLGALTREGPEAWFGQSVWIGFVITLALAELWIHRTRGLSGNAQGVAVPAVLSLASLPYIAVEPLLHPLHGDRRFDRLLERMGLPPVQ